MKQKKITSMEELCAWLQDRHLELARDVSHTSFTEVEIWFPWIKSAREKNKEIAKSNAKIKFISKLMHACGWSAINDCPGIPWKEATK